jgi:hypothetical protein
MNHVRCPHCGLEVPVEPLPVRLAPVKIPAAYKFWIAAGTVALAAASFWAATVLNSMFAAASGR